MKNLLILLLFPLALNAQNKGHVVDTTSNFSSIINPVKGMEVFLISDSSLNYYTGNIWLKLYDTLHFVRGVSYRSYHAAVTQSGTSAPTAVRMDNNFAGVTFTWARTATGTYTLTASSPVFTSTKTHVVAEIPGNALYNLTATINSTTQITFSSLAESVISLVLTLTGQDGILNNTLIEVRVYN